MKSLAVGALAISMIASVAGAQTSAPSTGPYKVLKADKVGGVGGFDYLYADVPGRKLYIPRRGPSGHMTVYDLDTLAPLGDIAGINAHGTAIDPKSGHGFASAKPVAMFDSSTLAMIKTIDVQGNPDGILGDPVSQRVYIFSHSAPNVTVLNAVDGAVVGTIDLGGAPEQAVTDGKGHLYVDLEDKDQVAVVDTKTLTKTGAYSLGDKCGGPGGLALDEKNRVLFVACHEPANMAMLNADTGEILSVLPIGAGVDGAAFNPNTLEALSTQGDGSLTVIKELSPKSFVVEQTVKTQVGARTVTLDTRTNHLFTATVEFGAAPAPSSPATSGGRPARGPMLPDSFTILEVGK